MRPAAGTAVLALTGRKPVLAPVRAARSRSPVIAAALGTDPAAAGDGRDAAAAAVVAGCTHRSRRDQVIARAGNRRRLEGRRRCIVVAGVAGTRSCLVVGRAMIAAHKRVVVVRCSRLVAAARCRSLIVGGTGCCFRCSCRKGRTFLVAG